MAATSARMCVRGTSQRRRRAIRRGRRRNATVCQLRISGSAATDAHLVKGSAMTYLPLACLRRNLATVVGNTGDGRSAAVLDRLGRGVRNAARSTKTPVVEDAVAWAKRRLAGKG